MVGRTTVVILGGIVCSRDLGALATGGVTLACAFMTLAVGGAVGRLALGLAGRGMGPTVAGGLRVSTLMKESLLHVLSTDDCRVREGLGVAASLDFYETGKQKK